METLGRNQACLTCKARRTRCNAARPKCDKCTRRNDECIYIEKPKRLDDLQVELSELEQRVLEVEKRKPGASLSLSDPSWTPQGWWELDEPPQPLRRLLFETFMPFASTLGLFLSPERLTRSFYIPEPFNHASRPSPALLSAIYLWGIVLSGSPVLLDHQSIFLSRAVYYANKSDQSTDPCFTKCTVQAELLILQYFLHKGFTAESKQHCDAAFQLALSEGIHQLRGIDVATLLTPSTDTIDLGERINAVWASYLADAYISCVYKTPSGCPDQCTEYGRINLPWPLDITQYEEGFTFPESIEVGTTINFIENPKASYAHDEGSFLSMECKAATLLKRATAFASDWNPDFPEGERQTMYAEFFSLSEQIDQFLDTVSPVVSYGIETSTVKRFQLIMVHCLANLATINLNVSSHWTAKSIGAATRIVYLLDNLELREIKFLHPIMGMFWSKSGDVLIAEYSRSEATPEGEPGLKNLTATLNRLEQVMKFFAVSCPAIDAQFRSMQNKLREIGIEN